LLIILARITVSVMTTVMITAATVVAATIVVTAIATMLIVRICTGIRNRMIVVGVRDSCCLSLKLNVAVEIIILLWVHVRLTMLVTRIGCVVTMIIGIRIDSIRSVVRSNKVVDIIAIANVTNAVAITAGDALVEVAVVVGGNIVEIIVNDGYRMIVAVIIVVIVAVQESVRVDLRG
jgi:hypothetical protein